MNVIFMEELLYNIWGGIFGLLKETDKPVRCIMLMADKLN
jgi:hypothetical protein